MITFSNLGKYGRLGNVLFEYAALKALANKLNCDAKIPPDLNDRLCDGQKCLLNCFNINCKTYTEEELVTLDTYGEKCKGGYYSTELWNCKPNTDICGWFESELYFENIKDVIKNEYNLKPVINNYATSYINKLKLLHPDHQIIGLHFRRGDYIQGFSRCCTKEWCMNYLNKAMKHFENIDKVIFLVFSGGSTTIGNNNTQDIDWCKKLLSGRNIYYSENHDTIHDFAIMTKCDHLIANSASTIVWWTGYLNKNPNKRIVVPTNIGMKSETTFWFDSCIKIDMEYLDKTYTYIGVRLTKSAAEHIIRKPTDETNRLKEYITKYSVNRESSKVSNNQTPSTVVSRNLQICISPSTFGANRLFADGESIDSKRVGMEDSQKTLEWNIEYFKKSITQFDNTHKPVIIICTGGSIEYGNNYTEDMSWCINYLKENRIVHAENNDIICDTEFAQMFDHIIIN